MKKYSMILCLMLALICALPTFAGAETQQEFELSCVYKTKNGANVHDFTLMTTTKNIEDIGDDEYVVDYISAGTYVQVESTGGKNREWKWVVYMKNGVKKRGWARVSLENCASMVRQSDGYLHPVHENDPDYDKKIKQGNVEFDVTQYSDYAAYAAYQGGLAPEPERKSDAAHSNSSAETNGTKSQNNSSGRKSSAEKVSQPASEQNGPNVGVVELGIVSSRISYNGQTVEVPTGDLIFNENVPADKQLAVIYAPKTGKASLRKTASDSAAVLKTCKAGVIVSVIEVGKTYTKVNYKGTIGHVKNSSLQFYSAASQDTDTGKLSYRGKTNGATTVNVRCKPDKESVVVATWDTGTAVRILSVSNGWYEIEAKGIHGYVMSEYLSED